MTFNPNNLKRMIDRHGVEVTYTRKTSKTYDPETGTGGSTPVSSTVKVYFYNYDLSEFDGENILFGDRQVVFPLIDTSGAAITEPKNGDTISGQGDTVRVVGIQKILSGTPTCYICRVRE